MKNKKIYIYTCILFTTFFLLFFVVGLKWIFAIGATFVLFFLYHLLKSLKFIAFSKKNPVLNILFALSYLVLALKIYYIYYNFIFSTIIIIVFVLFSAKNILKTRFQISIFYFLFIANILMFIIPHKYILINHFDNHILWKSNLKWEDFSSESKENSDIGAEIFTYFGGKVNKVYNYPDGIVFATMSKSKSWKNASDKIVKNSFLLNHEQKHFDIKEIFSNKAQDSINKTWGKSHLETQNIVDFFIKEEDKFQNKYDSITEHGTNVIEQKKYNKKISDLLNK